MIEGSTIHLLNGEPPRNIKGQILIECDYDGEFLYYIVEYYLDGCGWFNGDVFIKPGINGEFKRYAILAQE